MLAYFGVVSRLFGSLSSLPGIKKIIVRNLVCGRFTNNSFTVCKVLNKINFCFSKRKRTPPTLSVETIEARALLQKDWARYKHKEYMANIAQIDRIMAAQKRALDRLYEESEDLYNEAIMVRCGWFIEHIKQCSILFRQYLVFYETCTLILHNFRGLRSLFHHLLLISHV